MNFRDRIIEELNLSPIQADTLLSDYITTCEKLAKEYHQEQLDKPIDIELKSWEHTCGDNCCYTCGTELWLNGEKLEHPDPNQHDNGYLGEDIETGLKSVLMKLGYNVNITNV